MFNAAIGYRPIEPDVSNKSTQGQRGSGFWVKSSVPKAIWSLICNPYRNMILKTGTQPNRCAPKTHCPEKLIEDQMAFILLRFAPVSIATLNFEFGRSLLERCRWTVLPQSGQVPMR